MSLEKEFLEKSILQTPGDEILEKDEYIQNGKMYFFHVPREAYHNGAMKFGDFAHTSVGEMYATLCAYIFHVLSIMQIRFLNSGGLKYTMRTLPIKLWIQQITDDQGNFMGNRFFIHEEEQTPADEASASALRGGSDDGNNSAFQDMDDFFGNENSNDGGPRVGRKKGKAAPRRGGGGATAAAAAATEAALYPCTFADVFYEGLASSSKQPTPGGLYADLMGKKATEGVSKIQSIQIPKYDFPLYYMNMIGMGKMQELALMYCRMQTDEMERNPLLCLGLDSAILNTNKEASVRFRRVNNYVMRVEETDQAILVLKASARDIFHVPPRLWTNVRLFFNRILYYVKLEPEILQWNQKIRARACELDAAAAAAARGGGGGSGGGGGGGNKETRQLSTDVKLHMLTEVTQDMFDEHAQIVLNTVVVPTGQETEPYNQENPFDYGDILSKIKSNMACHLKIITKYSEFKKGQAMGLLQARKRAIETGQRESLGTRGDTLRRINEEIQREELKSAADLQREKKTLRMLMADTYDRFCRQGLSGVSRNMDKLNAYAERVGLFEKLGEGKYEVVPTDPTLSILGNYLVLLQAGFTHLEKITYNQKPATQLLFETKSMWNRDDKVDNTHVVVTGEAAKGKSYAVGVVCDNLGPGLVEFVNSESLQSMNNNLVWRDKLVYNDDAAMHKYGRDAKEGSDAQYRTSATSHLQTRQICGSVTKPDSNQQVRAMLLTQASIFQMKIDASNNSKQEIISATPPESRESVGATLSRMEFIPFNGVEDPVVSFKNVQSTSASTPQFKASQELFRERNRLLHLMTGMLHHLQYCGIVPKPEMAIFTSTYNALLAAADRLNVGPPADARHFSRALRLCMDIVRVRALLTDFFVVGGRHYKSGRALRTRDLLDMVTVCFEEDTITAFTFKFASICPPEFAIVLKVMRQMLLTHRKAGDEIVTFKNPYVSLEDKKRKAELQAKAAEDAERRARSRGRGRRDQPEETADGGPRAFKYADDDDSFLDQLLDAAASRRRRQNNNNNNNNEDDDRGTDAGGAAGEEGADILNQRISFVAFHYSSLQSFAEEIHLQCRDQPCQPSVGGIKYILNMMHGTITDTAVFEIQPGNLLPTPCADVEPTPRRGLIHEPKQSDRAVYVNFSYFFDIDKYTKMIQHIISQICYEVTYPRRVVSLTPHPEAFWLMDVLELRPSGRAHFYVNNKHIRPSIQNVLELQAPAALGTEDVRSRPFITSVLDVDSQALLAFFDNADVDFESGEGLTAQSILEKYHPLQVRCRTTEAVKQKYEDGELPEAFRFQSYPSEWIKDISIERPMHEQMEKRQLSAINSSTSGKIMSATDTLSKKSLQLEKTFISNFNKRTLSMAIKSDTVIDLGKVKRRAVATQAEPEREPEREPDPEMVDADEHRAGNSSVRDDDDDDNAMDFLMREMDLNEAEDATATATATRPHPIFTVSDIPSAPQESIFKLGSRLLQQEQQEQEQRRNAAHRLNAHNQMDKY
jgi:hypothetical protein